MNTSDIIFATFYGIFVIFMICFLISTHIETKKFYKKMEKEAPIQQRLKQEMRDMKMNKIIYNEKISVLKETIKTIENIKAYREQKNEKRYFDARKMFLEHLNRRDLKQGFEAFNIFGIDLHGEEVQISGFMSKEINGRINATICHNNWTSKEKPTPLLKEEIEIIRRLVLHTKR